MEDVDAQHYQALYWKTMTDLKTHIEYFHLYQERAERIDRRLKAILAVASNGSIATWAVWQRLDLLWAGIVGLSQLINAVKHLLPWEQRKERLNEANKALQRLFHQAERDWFDVAEGRLAAEEIHDRTMEIKETKSDIWDEHFDSSTLPDNERLLEQAAARTVIYFNAYLQS